MLQEQVSRVWSSCSGVVAGVVTIGKVTAVAVVVAMMVLVKRRPLGGGWCRPALALVPACGIKVCGCVW